MTCTSIVGIIWAFSLNAKLQKRPQTKVYEVRIDSSKIFTEKDTSDIQDQAHAQLKQVAEQAAVRLQQSLNNTVDQIGAHLNDMTESSLSQEFEKYQISLEALREQSIEEFSKLQRELESRRTQLSDQLDKKIIDEFNVRIDKFNGRLNDVVSSYLIDSLGSQVDLGAQETYIMKALEEHKDEIKKDILA
jgi:DNA anti-recombination protein RmuC